MRKTAQKIFATASAIVAIVLIVILVVTSFGAIEFEEFENSLVRGLFVTLGILYAVLAIVTLILMFTDSDVVKEITVRSDREGASKVTVGVIRKLVVKTCASIEGVKSGKIQLISNEFGNRLKVSVKIKDKDVVETEVYIRTMLEDAFDNTIGFAFDTIEIKTVSLRPKYEVTQLDVKEQVEEKLAQMAADKELEAEQAEQVESEIVESGTQEQEQVDDPEEIIDEQGTTSEQETADEQETQEDAEAEFDNEEQLEEN